MERVNPEMEAVVSRWRKVIWSVAILLPLIPVGVVAIKIVLGFGPPEAWSKFLTLNEVLGFPFYVLGFATICNWPFFVFESIVARHLRARWPDVVDIHWASIGGFIGLLVPYLLGYSALSYELMPGFKGGAGASIMLPLAGPIIGGALAFIGWFIGLGAAQLSRK